MIHVRLVVLVHVVVKELSLFNVVLVVLLPIKNLPVLLMIQPTRVVVPDSRTKALNVFNGAFEGIALQQSSQ